jgi:cell division protease FtsH
MAVELRDLAGGDVLSSEHADVGLARAYARRRRYYRFLLVLLPLCAYLTYRLASNNPVHLGLNIPDNTRLWLQVLLLPVLIGFSIILPYMGAGKSPHVQFSPEEIPVGLDDVVGAEIVKEEVIKSLNLFLAYKTFKERMGGTPRRALLFEGPPGTGKTYMAKAMAREAGVPFFFVSSSAFQSQFYGATNRKIRSYFKVLRKAARENGGAVGFIEEIDAIGASRRGMSSSTMAEGISGVVNELLIQLQSFDLPTRGYRLKRRSLKFINAFLPRRWHIAIPKISPANILVIGATNRAADLDPALLRPGRFDRAIYFDLPSRSGRREIIDYYLNKKAHSKELDDESKRETLAAMTHQYSPVMIEHLLDEALIWALRRGRETLTWDDVQQAKMTEEIGLAQPVEYTEAERRLIATHESGHATVAYFMGIGRKLEVLSIIKRKDALGLLAHSDTEERFTKTQSEIQALIHIAMGGMMAEELFFGEISTGVAGDLKAATEAAAQMVGSMGMAGSLISYEAIGAPNANLTAKVLSNDEGHEKVDKILDEAKEAARLIIEERRHVVEALRDALLEKDELLGDEIAAVINKAEAEYLPVSSIASRARRPRSAS